MTSKVRKLKPFSRGMLFTTASIALMMAGQGQAQSASECTAIYSTSVSGTSGELSFLDPLTKETFSLGLLNTAKPNALAVNPSNGYVYYIGRDANGNLYTYNPDNRTTATTNITYIDPSNGGTYDLGTDINNGYFSSTFGYIIGGAIAPDGSYYITTDSYQLWKLNISTGLMTRIGDMTYNGLVPATSYGTINGDLIFKGSQAYVLGEIQNGSVNNAVLWMLDPATGKLTNPVYLTNGGTRVTVTSTANAFNGIAVDPLTGNFYVSRLESSTSSRYYNLDPATGAVTNSVVQSVQLTDLGSCDQPPLPPTVTKTFSPTTAASAPATTTLTINIVNSNTAPYYLLDPLVDTLPTGMTVNGAATVSGSCYSTTSSLITANTGSGTVTLDQGAQINAGTCTITVPVRVTAGGTYTNTIAASSLRTTTGTNSSATSATFTVSTPAPYNGDLAITKTNNGGTADISGDTVSGTTTYTIRVTNTGSTSITGATLQDPASTGLSVTGVTCTTAAANKCTTAPTVSDVQNGYSLPALAAGEFFEINVTANVTALAGSTVTNTASVTTPSYVTDLTPSNNSATDSDSVAGTPPSCTTTITGLFFTSTDMYGGQYKTIAPVVRTTSPYTKGTVTATVPAGAAGYENNTALAVSPDGTKYYVPTPANGLRIYDTVAKTWSTVSTSQVRQNPTRAAMTPSGILYFGYDNLLWSYNPATNTVSSTTTLNYTDNSGLSPAPTLLSSGDFVSDADGNLYLISNVSSTAAIDLFKINPTTGAVTYVGRITGSAISSTTLYNGVAALSDGIYISSSSGQYLKLDLTSLTATEVSTASSSMASYDLTSCYYPVLRPQMTSTKTVTKVAGSAGTNVVAGDILEYTIVVRNSGTLNAGSSTFQDAIPTGTTYVAGSTTMNYGAVADSSGMPFATARAINSPGAASGVVEVDSTPATTTTSTTDSNNNEVVIKFRVTVNTGTTSVSNQGTVNYVDAAPLLTDDPTKTGTTDPTVTPVTTVADLSVTKTATPNPVKVGDNVTFTITLSNAGPSTATNVEVTDLLPSGYTLVSSTPATGTYTAGTGVWAVPSLASGSSTTLTVTATVKASGTYTNIAQVTKSDQADPDSTPNNNVTTEDDYALVAPTITPQIDLSTTKTISNSTPKVGDTVTFTVTVNNAAGFSDATGVTVTDLLPSGYTFVSATPSVGTYTSGTGVWTVGTVTAGATQTLTITATVNATGNYTNTAQVTAATQTDKDSTPNDGTGDDFSSITPTTVTPVADLAVTKTDGKTSVNAGGTTTYTITVTNNGPSASTALITDQAATGLTKTSVACSATPGTCTTAPTIAALEGAGFTTPSIPAGGTFQFTVTANVTATSGSVANAVTVATPSGTTDPTSGNNSQTDTDTVTPVADLSVTKTDGVTTVTNGQVVTYTIRVSNAGPSSVTGATLSDPVVSGLNVTGVTCSSTPGSCTTAPTVAQLQTGYALPTIASGSFYEIKVTGAITATAGDIVNVVTVVAPSGTTDPTSGNNSVTDTDSISAAPSLMTTKAVNNAYVKVAGDPNNLTTNPLARSQLTPSQLVYTVTVKNTGNVALNNVQVTDTLQSGLTYATGTTTGTSEPTLSGQQLTFTIPTLAVGATQTITFTVNVSMNANTNETPFLNTATATSGSISAPSNQVRTDVVYSKLFKQVRNLTTSSAWGSTGNGLPNDVLEYCINFNNYGTTALNNYRVSDIVPANTTYVTNSAVIKTGSLTAPGTTFPTGNVTYDSATNTVLASGMTVPADGSGTMCFQATIK